MPADFGSCDSSSARALELIPLYRAKRTVRRHLQRLASDGQLSWTSLVCGHFFDWGLATGFLHYDLDGRRALIFDGGEVGFSATTTETVALAVVAVLRLEAATEDRMLYIQSFRVTQNEVLRSLERVVGGERWRVEYVASERFIRETQEILEKDPEDAEAWERMVSVVGIVDANWEGQKDFANGLLGVGGEDLDQVVRKSVESRK